MSGGNFGLSLHPCIVGFKVPWPRLADLAAEIGYEGAVIPRQQEPEAGEPRARVRASGIVLPAEVRRDEATFESTFTLLEAACRYAAALGCQVAMLGIPPSSEQPRETQTRVYRKRLKRCCGVLDRFSIRLALECITPLHSRRTHPHEFVWRNDEMLEFGMSISPSCGLVIDSWHWHHAGGDPKWIRDVPADRILDVHIADSPALPPEEIRDMERLLPGEGVVDFGTFFGLLREKNYRGLLTVEVFGRGLGDMDPTQAARLAFISASQVTSTVRNRTGA